jgi:hypothetical protein
MDQAVEATRQSGMPPNPFAGSGAPRGTANKNVVKEKPPLGGGRGGSR